MVGDALRLYNRPLRYNSQQVQLKFQLNYWAFAPIPASVQAALQDCNQLLDLNLGTCELAKKAKSWA